MPRRYALACFLALSGVVFGAWEPSALAQPVNPPPASTGAATPPAPPAEDARKDEARAHFEKGVVLFRQSAWAPALAEFLESRRLFATRNATSNAAICLRNLQRFDEALGMYEALLKEFVDLPDDIKTAAQRALVELRELVGVIEIVGAELGAGITIDGRSRGDYPPVEPLRVPLGSHVVRVYKEGFEPFETRVDVAGGKTARTEVRLRALKLEEIGRLQVTEPSGKALEVLVDGVVVGKTPRWEGPIAVGVHTVALRGEGELGTQPASVPVKLRQVTALSLAAEELGAAIQVEPTPAGASVAIDSVVVGRGIWEGRLRVGTHQIEVAAEGFVTTTRQVSLDRGEREVVTVTLERDPSAARKPSRFYVEIGGAVPLTPGFGGDLGAGCSPECSTSRDLGIGGYGVLRVGYALGMGLDFGLSGGYLLLGQKVQQADAVIDIVGSDSDPSGAVVDSLSMQSFLVGAHAGLAIGERFPLHLRLGAGAMFGSFVDSRTGAVEDPNETLGRRGITRQASFFWLDPEVRVGVRLGDHFELTAGIEALVLIRLSPVRWERENEENVYINAGSRGAAQFPAEDIVGPAMVVLAPGLGARYTF